MTTLRRQLTDVLLRRALAERAAGSSDELLAQIVPQGAPRSIVAFLPARETAFVGVGFGLVNPPITNTAVSGVPASQAGVAAAVASTSRQVGLTLGVALAGAIAGGSAGAAPAPAATS